MRYILDSEGYIEELSNNIIECNGNTCIEYTGTTPTGYDSLEEWATTETAEGKLNAWKIVSGNLVYDANKYEELSALYTVQEEANANATHEWVRGQLGKSSSVVVDEFSNNTTGTSLIVLEDSGDYEIPNIELSSSTITGAVNVIASNNNLLGIEAVTTTVSGVTITINADGSITLDGTSTAAIEFTLKGTSTNTDMLFLIKQDTDYTVSGLTTGVNLNLYNYDGTNRTLVGSCTDETINIASTYIITQTTLGIPNGTTFNDVTISPQIELGSEATLFKKHKENASSKEISNNKATIDSLFSYSHSTVLMADKDVDISAYYFKYKSLDSKFAEIEVNEENITSQVNSTSSAINLINNTLETINSTMLTQTAEQFEMLFSATGVNNTLTDLQGLIDTQNVTLDEMQAYIRYGLITDSSDPFYGSAYIELGKDEATTKLRLLDNRIQFLTGTEETAYISNNALYINESTILTKQIIGKDDVGKWITEIDPNGNLNTYWGGVS